VYGAPNPYRRPLTAPKEDKMSLPKVRTHKEYQEFVKEHLKVHALSIPAFFMDVYVTHIP